MTGFTSSRGYIASTLSTTVTFSYCSAVAITSDCSNFIGNFNGLPVTLLTLSFLLETLSLIGCLYVSSLA